MKPPKGSSRFAILLKEIIRTNHKKLRLFYAVFKVCRKMGYRKKEAVLPSDCFASIEGK
jgi:hypothetical protein